jgi:hypothetical protein
MTVDLKELSQSQQHRLSVLQMQADWFGKFFMRRANEIIQPINDR